MKYHYYYQTSSNESKDEWIVASNRNDAYAQLRKRGIKPYKLLGKNPLAWKRWTAIAVLSLIVVFLAFLLLKPGRRSLGDVVSQEAEPRSQLYGDPAAIQQHQLCGWSDVFRDAGDAWLARHAIPALMCNCDSHYDSNLVIRTELIVSCQRDKPEINDMRLMVNGMKQELEEYTKAGGTILNYMRLCDERLQRERTIVEITANEFEKLKKEISSGNFSLIAAEWMKKNDFLRSMGLPTVPMPMETD